MTMILAILAGIVVSSCRNLDDLEKRVNTVESRVQALETQVNALNENIKAINALMSAGTIKEVTEKDGAYSVLLSNGKKITLNQGSVGVANAPVMSVDNEGYWMVDYGKGKVYVKNGDNKVKATGTNGATPKFSVDADGYWTVSYDDGATFVQVKDASGKPVNALPSGEVSDPYFKSADYDKATGVFSLVLKDGTSLTLPVVSSFFCSIAGADEMQVFNYAETKTYVVTLEGVSQTVVSAPSGWNASLNGTVLSVTSPASTKAILADTNEDVSILALSASGYATVAKVKVRLSDTPIVVNPTAALTLGEVTATSISFNVALSDADTWKYMVLTADQNAPAADAINASGIVGEGASATVENLSAGTDYVVYVLPMKGSKVGAVASLPASTSQATINDYYQAYSDGKDIMVAGVKYNKATNGDATLVTATQVDQDLKPSIHQKAGVFFLEQNEGCNFNIPSVTEITGKVVLISRYADKNAALKPTMCMKLKSGSLIMKNIDFDMSLINGGTNAGYAFNNANSTERFNALHLDGCNIKQIQKPILYANVPKYGFKSVVVENCRFQVIATNNTPLFNFYKSTVLDTYEEMVFKDNVVYNAACSPVQIMSYDHNTAQTGTTWNANMTIENNIFYNVPSGNGYFKFYRLKSLSMRGNVFWADPAGTPASYCFILYSPDQDAAALTISDNIAYGLSKAWSIAHSSSTVKPDPNVIDKLGDTPFESFSFDTGAYVLKSEYAAYGPRK